MLAASIMATAVGSGAVGGVEALDAGGAVGEVAMEAEHKAREAALGLGGEGSVVGAVGLSAPRREAA